MLLMQVIAEHLSVEEVAGIKEAFDMMDTNKRGKINLEELRTGLQKLGHQIPDADLQILMDAVCIGLFLFDILYVCFSLPCFLEKLSFCLQLLSLIRPIPCKIQAINFAVFIEIN